MKGQQQTQPANPEPDDPYYTEDVLPEGARAALDLICGQPTGPTTRYDVDCWTLREFI